MSDATESLKAKWELFQNLCLGYFEEGENEKVQELKRVFYMGSFSTLSILSYASHQVGNVPSLQPTFDNLTEEMKEFLREEIELFGFTSTLKEKTSFVPYSDDIDVSLLLEGIKVYRQEGCMIWVLSIGAVYDYAVYASVNPPNLITAYKDGEKVTELEALRVFPILLETELTYRA